MNKYSCFTLILLIFAFSANAQLKKSTKDIAKNKIKLSVNYSFDYGVNAFILGANFTKIRGYLLQLEYCRNLHKRVAVGLSAGYANGIDKNNPELDTLDYEISKYLHFVLQGFIINNLNNRFYVKVSAGLTHTDRLHSTLRVTPWNEERGFQYSNHADLTGFTAEIGYDRQITKNLFAALNVGILSHNDGATFAGCSIGYAF